MCPENSHRPLTDSSYLVQKRRCRFYRSSRQPVARGHLRSGVNYNYVPPSPFISGLSADILRTICGVSFHKDFVGSKRELSPNRARQTTIM